VREHGTHARYVVDRCRCDRCRAATREYERERRARIEPAYVSAGPARRHVEELRAAGVGLKQVAKAAGLPHGTLCLTANLHQRDGVYGGLSARERRALRSTEEVAS
jgi:hypothetical protein